MLSGANAFEISDIQEDEIAGGTLHAKLATVSIRQRQVGKVGIAMVARLYLWKFAI
jgi:hypothetical protein